MNFLSFKKMNFFKNKGNIIEKTKKISSTLTKKEELNFWKKLGRNPFLYIIIFVCLLSYLISYLPSKSLSIPKEDEIATSDITAPLDLTIEDIDSTEKRREKALQAVLPVYNVDENVFLNTEEKIREFSNSGREFIKNPVSNARITEFKNICYEKYGLNISTKDISSLIKNGFSKPLEENIINLVYKTFSQGIILSKNLFIHDEQEKGLTLIRDPENENSVKVSEILDIEESKSKLSEEIDKLDISRNDKMLFKNLCFLFISPNITYNPRETESRKENAIESVETVFYTIKRGKVIVRKGDEVNAEAIKQIKIINQNLSSKPSWLKNFIGTFFLFSILFIILWYYLKSVFKAERALKKFIMMGAILIISLLFYKLSIFLADILSQNTSLFFLKYSETYRYAFPLQLGSLIFAFLTTIPVTLIYTILNSILVGYLFKANFHLMIFSLIGGFAAIYGIKYYGKQKRSSTLRAGLFLITSVNTIMIIIFHLIMEKIGPVDVLLSEIFMGILGGIISAVLAFLILPIFESLFGFITQSKIFELTNSDLPIFRQMAIEAPGSYHHSLIVASLSEGAAEKLKLDSMLVKTGALYHDIGKIKRPEYFSENRTKNSDLHKDLKPSMSALVIVNHVKEGLEIAKKLKLPKKIKDIIEQHHGNSLVKYFFEKAKENYDPEMNKIGEESYRYPGPRPKSKEAALVMLADSVEAASRSLKNPSKTNLTRVVSEIFNNYLQDGQLDNCDFSFRELKVAASSFLEVLYTIYHPRVKYPGFDFEMKKKKNIEKQKVSNDRNNKSTT